MSLPRILDVVNEKVVINEVILGIPQFNKLYNSLDNDTAIKCFQYIWAMYDPESPYFNYDEIDREEEVLKDFPVHQYLNEIEMIQAIEKAEKMYFSPIRKILRGTKNAIEKLVLYFDTMEIESGRDGNITAVKAAIVDMPKMIKSYQEAEQAYRIEVQKSRGNVQESVDEDYEDNFND